MKVLFSYMLLFCYTTACLSCHTTSALQKGETIKMEVKDQRGNPELLGTWTEDRLRQAPYDSWFVKNYADYTLDSLTADQLRGRLTGKNFLIFMGTWCGDSKREVPRMYRILHYCGIPPSSIQLIMVSDADSLYKQSPGHEERGRDIFRVPVLIVLDHGREQGRIIESPVSSLEKDLLSLANKEAYQPHYRGVSFLAQLFKKEKPASISGQLQVVSDELRPLVRSAGELASYARVLKAAGEGDKAAITLQLNALLFPQ